MQVHVLVRMARTTVLVVVFLFTALGVAVTPPPVLSFWVVLGLALGVAAWKAPSDLRVVRRLNGSREPDLRTGVRAGGGFVVLGLSTTGMIATIGLSATAGLVVVFGVVAVWVRLRARPVPEAPHAREVEVITASAPFEPSAPADALRTEELCLAWRRSYFLLQRAADDHTRQAVVRARQAYLDELEKRDGAGFSQWLAGGARAGSDPRPYFTAE